MAEEKKRVILYADLRKKISNMEVYSFDEKKKKRLEEMKKPGHLSVSHPEADFDRKDGNQTKGIQKNSLSMSIDELIDEQISIEDQSEKKNAKREFRKKKEKHRPRFLNTLIWCLCGAVVLVFVILIIYLLIR